MVELLYPSASASASCSSSPSSPAIPYSFFAPDLCSFAASSPAPAPARATTAAVASASRPDPCPLCRFRAEDEYSLLLHIETSHVEDSPFVPDNDARATRAPTTLIDDADDADDYDPEYVLCPESDCAEFIPLLELQTHMDFHDAANLSMEQTGVPSSSSRKRRDGEVAETRGGGGGGSGGERSSHHHRRRDGERGERRRDGKEEGKHHRHREPGEHREHRKRREEKEKDPKVSFIPAPTSRSRSPGRGLSWFERVALAIAQPHHTVVVPDRQRSRSRRRSRSRGAPKRSDSKKRSDSAHVRRSDSKRRSDSISLQRPDGKRVEIRKGKSAPPPPGPPKSEKAFSGIKKLGKSDLGPHAHEVQMPSRLRAELEKGGKAITVRKIDLETGRQINVVQIANETPDLIYTMALLSERDPNIVRAYLCHPGTKHVGKQLHKEGGFCGYRNIQMMISYIQAAFPSGSHPFEGRIPTILKMQDLIEEGWDMGINSTARLETGGIRGTRKYIGTSEAQTLFTSVGLQSRASAFTRAPDQNSLLTQKALLAFVEEYFLTDLNPEEVSGKIVRTIKPPIYLQHSGHSMTIVGLEKWRDGSNSLLVFDPFFSPTEAMKNLAGRKISSKIRPDVFLKVYRRRMSYLAKYKEFEVILLVPPSQATTTSNNNNTTASHFQKSHL